MRNLSQEVHNSVNYDQGGEKMAKDVMCRVENCRFWDNQNCKASAIEVNVDGGGQNASYTAETNCHTFENRK
jgi:hypothetical protein